MVAGTTLVVASFTYIEKALVDKHKTSNSLSAFHITNEMRVLSVHCLESYNFYIFMFHELGKPKQALYQFMSFYQSRTLEFVCSFAIHGKTSGQLRWNCFLCSIHAWEEYSRFGPVSCLLGKHGGRWNTYFREMMDVFCALFIGKRQWHRLRWNFFLSSIHAWDYYSLIETVVCTLKIKWRNCFPYETWRIILHGGNNGGRSKKCFGRNYSPSCTV